MSYRKNVSGQNVTFLLIDSTTFGAKTGASPSGSRSRDGGSSAAVTGSISEIGNGMYNLAMSAADCNADSVGFVFTASGAIPGHANIATTEQQGDLVINSILVNDVVNVLNGIQISCTTTNRSALKLTGNGSGPGLNCVGGTTGNGITTTSGASGGQDLFLGNTSTNMILAKSTNITGFNDIAATAIVSSGAITTSSGAVTTVTNLTNAATSGDLTATMKIAVEQSVWGASRSGYVTAGTFGRAIQNISRDNTAQAGASTTITLDSSASSSDDFYNNSLIEIIGGTGVGQSRFITDYVGSSKVATVSSAWITNPDNTSKFNIEYFDAIASSGGPTAAQIATAVWQDATSGDFTVSSSIGKSLYTSGAVPGAAGGLFISGSNAATTVASLTCTGAFTVSDGIIVTVTTTNRSGIASTGNGFGAGMFLTGGSSSGSGLYGSGNGSGHGIFGQANGTTGSGIRAEANGGGTGSGLYAICVTGSGNGATFTKGASSGVDFSAQLSEVATVVNAVTVNANQLLLIESGTAQAGASTTITLESSASSVNDIYNGTTIKLVGNTGFRQARVIIGYNGSTKVATVNRAWQTNPDSSTTYTLHATDAPKTNSSLEVSVSGLGAFPTNFSSLSIDGSGRVDVGKTLGTAVTLDGNNVLNVSAKYLAGTALTGRDIGASILLSSGTGTGQISISSGQVTVGTNNDKTGYALTQSFPSNFSSLSIDGSGLVDITQTAADKVWSTATRVLTAGTNIALAKGTGVTGFNDVSATQVENAVWDAARSSHISTGTFGVAAQIIRDGTAQAGASTTITLDSGASASNSFYNNSLIKIVSGTGVGQSRLITSYVGSSKVATVNSAWTTNPDNTSVFVIDYFDIITAAQVATGVWQDTTSGDFTVSSSIGKSLFTSGAVPGTAGGLFIAGSNAATTVNFTGSLSGSVGSISGVTFPTNFASFSIDGSGRVDVIKIAGTTQTARDIGTSVLLSSGTGTGQISLSSGQVTVGTNNDKTGYALTQTFPTNFSSFSIDASGRVDVAKIKGTASAGAAGYVGIDWANITAPTTTVNLSGTTIGTLTTYTGNSPQTGDSFARLGAPSGANIAADIAAITSNNPTLQSGTATAGGASTITIQTAIGADDLPNGCIIYISSGTGAKQARIIIGYINSTKVVTVDRNWTTNPDNTSVYSIIYNHLPAITTSQKITGVATTDLATTVTNLTNAATNGDLTSTMKTSVAAAVWNTARSSYITAGTFGQSLQLSRDGTAQAGAAGTITLDASANANNSFYNNCLLTIISGTGVGQSRFITGYNGSTKVATLNSNWTTNPDNTSVFNIHYFDAIPGATAPTAAQVATAVWQDLTAGSDFSTSNSIGALLKGFTFTVAGYVDANTLKVGGTTQTARDLGTSVLISSGTGTGQIDITSGIVKANAAQILGTAISTPATAGILDVNVKNINNVAAATPGASGGLLISGSNAGTTTLAALTITGATTHTGNVSMAAGLNITQSGSNTSALIVTGNGTGHGALITSGSGATGDGVRMVSGATNGSGLVLTATGTGKDLKTTNTSTDIVLAKTTNITGFNDIAATAVVSSGAITTSGGAVSTVTTVTNLTNAPTAGDLTATMKTSVTAAVWDAARSSYVSANSFGRALQVSRDGTAQAGGGTTITLDASANANNSFYNNCLVEIIGGTGIGQCRFVTGYVGSTKVATVNSSWTTNPDNTSVFVIKFFDQVPGASAPTAAQVATAVWQDTTSSDFTTSGSVGQAVFNFNQYVRRGTAQAGASTTITLDASASATDDIYNYELIEIISGTGVGQGKFITDYVGSTKVATVDSAWAVNPDNTSVFLIKFFAQAPGASAPTAAQVATAVWTDVTGSDFTASGSIGKSLFTSGAVPGAAGGLAIAGSNAATTFATLTVTGNTTLSDGLIVNRSSSNTSAVVLTGNGSGSAISGIGGATGNAITLAGGATSGRGISITTTDGYGIYVSALGSTGAGVVVLSDASDGISVRGGTTGGSALTLLARGGNATGLFAGGNGAGRGIVAQGGTTGIGFLSSGGSTSGDATVFQTTDGHAFKLDSFGTGMDLFLDNQSTNVILAKTTNITGFNDLAATDITSTGGPITLTAGFVESDVKAIDGSTSAATRQSKAALAVVTGTVTATSTTTSVVSSDLSSGITDNYINRVLVMVTGAGSYQASVITAFNSGTDTIEIEGLQTAPSVGNTFIIV